MSHKFSMFIRKYGNVFVIIALIIIFTLLNPVFLSVYNFMNIVRQIAMVGIISVGFTFAYYWAACNRSYCGRCAGDPL